MRVTLVDYFGEYSLILAWEDLERGWRYLEGAHAYDPIVGIPDLGEAYLPLLKDFSEGPDDSLDLGLVRFVKSTEDDPERFNFRVQRPIAQAFRVMLGGDVWGVCARVLRLGRKPELLLHDDSDGKLLSVLYGGVRQYMGTDFRFWTSIFQESAPELFLEDVADVLKSVLSLERDSDELFRIFQERLRNRSPSLGEAV